MKFRNVAAVSIAATISAVALGMAGAQAADSVFGSTSIRDDSIRSVDVKDGTLLKKDLSATAVEQLHGQAGAQGPQGEKGAKGDSGLLNAFYATALYNDGDTNAGAIATVACDTESTNYTAISGGVQVLGLDEEANSRNTPVSSSFPGRMDWSTGTPTADRLDGWIVQFGGNAGAAADRAPEQVKVWALCVPGADIPAHQTFSQH